jgi:GNAT superfamily N-acetyltransferase
MSTIRRCADDEHAAILGIVNAAAERYRGVIPPECWHEPYMDARQLAADIDAGVIFWGFEDDAGQLVGVMGVQRVKDVTLIRHAYVRPGQQGSGIGSRLLRHLESPASDASILIGTWAQATWAIRFYQGHGYSLVPPQETPALLRTYWNIPARQLETSVVLVKPTMRGIDRAGDVGEATT